jgi:hypothetical protein
MYNVEVGTLKSICFSTDEVANLIYKTTGMWKISKRLRETCPGMNVGDIKKIEDIIVERII